MTPARDTLEKYRNTPPISVAMLLQRHTPFLVGSSLVSTHLYAIQMQQHCHSLQIFLG